MFVCNKIEKYNTTTFMTEYARHNSLSMLLKYTSVVNKSFGSYMKCPRR